MMCINMIQKVDDRGENARPSLRVMFTYFPCEMFVHCNYGNTN